MKMDDNAGFRTRKMILKIEYFENDLLKFKCLKIPLL